MGSEPATSRASVSCIGARTSSQSVTIAIANSAPAICHTISSTGAIAAAMPSTSQPAARASKR